MLDGFEPEEEDRQGEECQPAPSHRIGGYRKRGRLGPGRPLGGSGAQNQGWEAWEDQLSPEALSTVAPYALHQNPVAVV